MIIPPKILFCLNVKTTLNKWKVIAEWKATTKKKEFSLTYLQFIRVVEDKREKGKRFNTSGHNLKPFTQSLFFCVNLARNTLKVSFFLNTKKKKRQFMEK